jgi:hypothetical protein
VEDFEGLSRKTPPPIASQHPKGNRQMALSPQVIAAARAAKAAYPKGPPASVTLAQWIIESESGRYVSGKNNYFGIKATPEQITAGQATMRLTHETIDGVYQKKNLYFADYPDERGSFMAHSALLCDPRMEWAYGDCWRAATPDAYAMALQKHYATGIPGHPYGPSLIAVMRSEGLYRYDHPDGAPAPTPARKPSHAANAAAATAATTGAAASTYYASGGSHLLTWIIGGAFALAAIAFVADEIIRHRKELP